MIINALFIITAMKLYKESRNTVYLPIQIQCTAQSKVNMIMIIFIKGQGQNMKGEDIIGCTYNDVMFTNNKPCAQVACVYHFGWHDLYRNTLHAVHP